MSDHVPHEAAARPALVGGDRRLPDRGRARRRRTRTLDLGRLRRDPRRRARRLHGRARARTATTATRRTSICSRASASTGTGSRSRGCACSRPARDRRIAAGIDYYDRVVDALLDAGVTPFPTLYHWDLPTALEQNGRMARPRDRLPVRRLHGSRRRRSRRPREALVHDQRAGLDVAAGLRDRRARPGPAAPVRIAAHGPPPAARPRSRHPRPAGTRCGRRSGSSTTTPTCIPPRPSEADQAAAFVYDILHNRIFAEPVLLGALSRPRGVRAAADAGRAGRSRDHLHADGCLRPQLLQPDHDRRRRAGEPDPVRDRADARRRHHRVRPGLADRPRGAHGRAGRLPRALRRAPAADHHRGERRVVPGARRRHRTDRRCRAHRLPRRPHRGGRAGARARRAASTSTRCGRCSTTSSGPRDSPSDSGSSTSTTRPESARPRRRSTGTALSSRRHDRDTPPQDASGRSGSSCSRSRGSRCGRCSSRRCSCSSRCS